LADADRHVNLCLCLFRDFQIVVVIGDVSGCNQDTCKRALVLPYEHDVERIWNRAVALLRTLIASHREKPAKLRVSTTLVPK
jgi:hypothetical protein